MVQGRHRVAGLVLLSILLGLTGWALAAGAGARPARYFPPACPTVTFHSDPALGAQRVCMNLGVSTHAGQRGSYLFLTPALAGAGIYTRNGTLVWWLGRPSPRLVSYDVTVVHLWGRPYLAVWSGRWTRRGYDQGSVTLYDQHYRKAGVVTAGSPFPANRVDLHDFRVTPQGDALIGIWDPVKVMANGRRQAVIQYVVQKLSLVRGSGGIRTGRVLFQWKSLTDVPVSQSHQGDPAKYPWDYFHGNSVAQDADGNLLVSGRNTWGIYKISVRTGHVMWEVGARHDHTLRTPWCDQHDITPLGDNRYSLFDDGAGGPGCVGHSGHASRGLIFRVIPSGKRPRIRLVRSYAHHPAIHSDWLGGVQRLPDGRFLIDWGVTPEVTEYGPRGRSVDLDLSLSGPSYRAFSFRWDGRPDTPPSVAASSQTSGTTVWASWNGSTEVVAWRVLAGATPAALAPVTGPVSKAGFESTIRLGSRYGWLAVQALGRGGRVLATSKTIAPAGS